MLDPDVPLSSPESVLSYGAKILVIEDDPQIARVLRVSLSSCGYLVRTAANGSDGLEQISAWSPDLITTDLAMPLMDGVELCRRIRAISPIPIVVMSADGAEDSRIKAFDAGANDYIAKPFNMPEVHAVIRANLRRAHT